MNGKTTIIEADKIFDNIHDTTLIMDQNDGYELFWKWPGEIGIGNMSRIKLRSGIALGFGDFKLLEDIAISVESDIHMPVVFHFYASLYGDSIVKCIGEQNEFSLARPGFGGSITYLRKWQGAFKYPKGIRVRGLSVFIDPFLLKPFMDGEADIFPKDLWEIADGNNEKSFIRSFKLNHAVNNIINQVFQCPYTGSLKRFFFEAKTIELITYGMAQMTESENSRNNFSKLHPNDIKRVSEIKKVLLSNLEKPPSLSELARKSGTNKNKLNSDFRMIYGTSVFEFFRRRRLEQAKELLESRKMNVTEVAFEVGYAHQQSFTRAFRNYFGTNPIDYFK